MITQNKTVSNVSYIQSETMKQKQKYETTSETKYETRKNAIDIKALAIRVLEQSKGKQCETVCATKLETEIKSSETQLKQKLNIEDLLYIFEERVAIMMFDGKMNETEATNQAFLEFLENNFLNTL